MDDTLRKTLHTIYNSKRPMPAHFTSDDEKGRTQSFCVDYDIPADDEYEMASVAWYSLGEILPEDFEIGSYAAYVKPGEDIMIGAYILTKEGKGDLINDLKTEIINNSVEGFSQAIANYKETISNPAVVKYFDHCAEFGGQRAKM